MAVVPTFLVSQLVSDVRTDSDLNRSQVYSDDQIATLISDAGSSLYDKFTQANQHYNISTFDFTLAGGPNGNSVPLPVDFQQGHSVDVNPGTAQPYTLRYLANWLDRNRTNTAPFAIWGPGGGPREYYFLGAPGGSGTLVVLPPMAAAGIFRLYYTPMWIPLAIPSVAAIPADNSGITPTIASFTTTNSIISWNNTAWGLGWVGRTIVITGAANAANNGTFTISNVLNPGAIEVSGATFVSEGAGATGAVEPLGTTSALPTYMNPWVMYLKTIACITIRNKRGQDVEAFMAKLGIDEKRIESILQERQEEPQQPPLTRNSGFLGGW